jgi:hypothetical protein
VLWEELNGHWGYEDGFYRFYHGSIEVYRVQSLTEKAVKFLRGLLPERELNESFMAIIREGTGKEFERAHNRERLKHTPPFLKPSLMRVTWSRWRCATRSCQSRRSRCRAGGAGLLYLYDLR